MKIGDLEAHEHTCSSCKATMKHYHKGGCNIPAEIECESCKEKRTSSGQP